MVTDPAKWILDFAKAGASMFTFHLEAIGGGGEEAVTAIINKIRASGMKVRYYYQIIQKCSDAASFL